MLDDETFLFTVYNGFRCDDKLGLQYRWKVNLMDHHR